MKRVLFVDDDAVISGLYQKALALRGFDVTTASDGLNAVQILRTSKPDVVVLDLMMPKFSGVDVLRFMRSESALRELPVIVLTNSYMNELAEKAASLGVQKALLKVRCSPTHLVAAIDDVLAGNSASVPAPAAPPPPTSPQPAPPSPTKPPPPPAPAQQDNPATTARQSFISNAGKIRSELHTLAMEFTLAQLDTERDLRLQSLYRRVGFLGATAGLAKSHRISLLASALEALLFELIPRPDLITQSVRRTVVFTVEYLGQLLNDPAQIVAIPDFTARILVVDDDPLSNRLITAALQRIQLDARSTEDPLTALQQARETQFGLFLMDIEMPGMDGFELCKQIRTLPGYQQTPVIFVTSHGDFEHRAKSVHSGGNDLIAKPVFPLELAVKAVTQLLKASLGPNPPTAS